MGMQRNESDRRFRGFRRLIIQVWVACSSGSWRLSESSWLGPYGVRIDNLLSISRSFVGGGSVPRSESPDGAGSYRTVPQGPLFRDFARKSVDSTSVTSPRRAHLLEICGPLE